MLQICHALAKMSHGSPTMTSPTIPAFSQPDPEGRSVRDVVEYSPEEVNEAWCRKVLRKILHSLELQYGMQMPHRAITPDTIVLHANGEPLLILDDIDAAPAPDAQLADDLTALARVIHYAITQELAPAGPLDGRVAGYSAALVATVDACMDPDPTRRPRNVDAVRSLLDVATPVAAPVAAPAPLAAAVAAVPPVTPDPVVAMPPAGMRRGQRRAIAAGGGALAILLALVWFARTPDKVARAPIALTLPQTGAATQAHLPAPGSAAPESIVVGDGRTNQAAIEASDNPSGSVVTAPEDHAVDSPATGTSSGGTTRAGGGADEPDVTTRVAPDRPSVAAAAPPGAVSGNASYQLQIKPWGNVYVDGVERGVSPPLKRLALPPGRHTVRITNPQYRDSILEFESAGTTSNGKIIVDFDHEAQ
jgi:hypothetical protein